MNLVIFTKYTEKGPSSRYRHYQYLPYYKNYFNCKIYPFFPNSYNYNSFSFTLCIKIAISIIKRIFHVFFMIKKNDIILIEYELIPYFPPFLEFIISKRKIKFILDFDDAIFHNYDNSNNKLIRKIFQNKIPKISKFASFIITGNSYLTSYFLNFNKNIIEIPTCINFEIYNNKRKKISHETINIGWLGSNSTSKNLLLLQNVFQDLKIKYKDKIKIILCGFDKNLYKHFKYIDIEYIEWSNYNEFTFLNSIDIGIMPLDNNNFNKGKCGFKLIQYMAMGIPTVSYPFAANLKIDNDNGNLFASNELEWFLALNKMIDNISFYNEIGIKNITTIKNIYSIESNFIQYINLIKNLTCVRN